MKRQLIQRLRKSLIILFGGGTASFLTMLLVQALMGGIRNVEHALGQSILIGIGMAFFVFILPSQQNQRYPWQ